MELVNKTEDRVIQLKYFLSVCAIFTIHWVFFFFAIQILD